MHTFNKYSFVMLILPSDVYSSEFLKIQVCVKLSGIGVASCSNFHFHKHFHLHCLKCTKMNPFQIFYTHKQRSDKEEVNKYDSILELLKKNKCAKKEFQRCFPIQINDR